MSLSKFTGPTFFQFNIGMFSELVAHLLEYLILWSLLRCTCYVLMKHKPGLHNERELQRICEEIYGYANRIWSRLNAPAAAGRLGLLH